MFIVSNFRLIPPQPHKKRIIVTIKQPTIYSIPPYLQASRDKNRFFPVCALMNGFSHAVCFGLGKSTVDGPQSTANSERRNSAECGVIKTIDDRPWSMVKMVWSLWFGF